MSDTPYVISGLGTADEDTDVKRIVVFAVPNPEHAKYDGPKKDAPPALIEYTMPAEVNPILGLEYGEKSDTNPAAAAVWLIKETVGEDGYRALVRECKKMSPKKSAETIKVVSEKISAIALGN